MPAWIMIALPVVVILLVIYGIFQREKVQALARYRNGGTIVETALGPVEYDLVGEGQPILIMHGGSSGGYEFAELFHNIMGSGFQCICPSRPGHRQTPIEVGPDYAGNADCAAALLDTLGFEKVYVLGHSAGGPAAIQFALGYPERCESLILLSANGPGTAHHLPAQYMLNLMKTLMKSDFVMWFFVIMPPSIFLKQDGNLPERLTPDVLKEAAKHNKLGFPISDIIDGTISNFNEMPTIGEWPIPEINTPTLLIHGTRDTFVRYEVAQFHSEKIPNAELVTYDDGAHYIFLTHKEEIRRDVNAFLRTSSKA